MQSRWLSTGIGPHELPEIGRVGSLGPFHFFASSLEQRVNAAKDRGGDVVNRADEEDMLAIKGRRVNIMPAHTYHSQIILYNFPANQRSESWPMFEQERQGTRFLNASK